MKFPTSFFGVEDHQDISLGRCEPLPDGIALPASFLDHEAEPELPLVLPHQALTTLITLTARGRTKPRLGDQIIQDFR